METFSENDPESDSEKGQNEEILDEKQVKNKQNQPRKGFIINNTSNFFKPEEEK